MISIKKTRNTLNQKTIYAEYINMNNNNNFTEEDIENLINTFTKSNITDIVGALNCITKLYGYIPPNCLPSVAKYLNIETNKIQSIISFNNCYSLEAQKKQIQICVGHACSAKGSLQILNKLQKHTDLDVKTCKCFGDCTNAIVVKLNNTKYNKMDLDKCLNKLI